MRILVVAVVIALAGACGSPVPTPSPAIGEIDAGIVVGSEISCATNPAMQRHCDAWVANARTYLSSFPGAPTGTVTTWTIHVGWSTVARTGAIPAVVVFRLGDGSTVNVPVFCAIYPQGDAACDVTDVTLPPT